jgi:hypothetical protein
MWQSHFKTLPGTSPKVATMPTNVSTVGPANPAISKADLAHVAAKMLAQTGTTTAKPTCPT